MRVNGKKGKRIALLMALVMALSMELMHVAAADADSGQMEVSLDVTYGQTDARAMLDLINDFRTGEDAWALNSEGEKVTFDNLGELTYDYDLEQIAMQRAAEIAISFMHTRPNGESSSTVTCNGTRSSAENIAVGYGSQGKIEKIFNFLQETDEGYSGQIHRRIMLSSDYTAVGIGHVRYKGMDYWVQEFGTASNSPETSIVDGDASVSVSIATSKIKSASLAVDGDKEYTLVSGESVNIPSASLTFYVAGAAWAESGTMFARTNDVTTDVTPDWISSDSGIVAVKDGKFVAGQVGNATLTATYMGASVEIAVNVVEATAAPTSAPTAAPTSAPTAAPTSAPTSAPTAPTAPTSAPTAPATPTSAPTAPTAPTSAPISTGNKPSESASSVVTSADHYRKAEQAIVDQIKSAEAGSTIVMDKGTTTLSNYVMKELLKKGDVSLKLEFTYNGEEYVIVIPAGAALDNDIPWYGPLYLAQQYGNSAGNAATDTSGIYVVKRGDTLIKIAAANNMTLKQLLTKNPQIRDANKIVVGEKINR